QHHHLNRFTGNPLADQRPDGIAVVRQQGAFTHAMTSAFGQLLQGVTAAVGCCSTAVGESQNGEIQREKFPVCGFGHNHCSCSKGQICCHSAGVLAFTRV